jgi:hypothetical protein
LGQTGISDHAFAFHRLFSDHDGTGRDGLDSRGFRGALGSEAGMPTYNSIFDFAGTGMWTA